LITPGLIFRFPATVCQEADFAIFTLQMTSDDLRYSSHNLKIKIHRPSREQTRELILQKSEELFRHFGFGKTTVADIAKDLDMSTANIYKFFPSKEAIIEASGERNLNAMKESFLSADKSSKSAIERMEILVLTIFRAHQDIFRNEKQVYKLVLTAREGNWACVRNFHDFLLQSMTAIVEVGMKTHEFRTGNAVATAKLLLNCLHPALDPLLLRDPSLDMNEKSVRAQVRFIGKALQ
jgi:AcrR family transcriptional regulator